MFCNIVFGSGCFFILLLFYFDVVVVFCRTQSHENDSDNANDNVREPLVPLGPLSLINESIPASQQSQNFDKVIISNQVDSKCECFFCFLFFVILLNIYIYCTCVFVLHSINI